MFRACGRGGSAMMRELKKMREEHLLAVDGRAVTLYAGI